MPTEFQPTLRAVADKARRFKERGLGEQNTKASLVEPVLEALGWDIRDPDEVHREYRPTGKDSPVDYALKLMRKARLFVEAKGLGETLSDRKWIAQVLGYATVAGVEWCVLTDGDEYRFYNASAPIDAEEKMFCRVKLTDGKDAEAAAALDLISRKNLEQNLLDVLWVSHFVDRRVKAALTDLLGGADKAVVRFIRKRAPKLNPKEIAESLRRLEVRIESPAVLLSPSRAAAPASPKAAAKPKRGRKARSQVGVSLRDVIGAGVLKPPVRLFRRYKGRDIEATLQPDGTVEFQGSTYESCSTAAEVARGTVTGRRMNTNGWSFWQYADEAGKKRILDVARRALRNRQGVPGTPLQLRLSGGESVSRSG